jgi:predicted nucleic acid-binding protein
LVEKPKYYWDACMWIALINREANRYDACKYIIEQAQRGEVEIWTSAFTFAEVFKKKCSPVASGLSSDDDQAFEDYIEQEFVKVIQVDTDVGRGARRLLRAHPSIGKPQDAIHVASALIESVAILHTFDNADLLGLDGQLKCQDGNLLKIQGPSEPPDPDAGTMFEGMKTGEDKQDDGKKAKSVRT